VSALSKVYIQHGDKGQGDGGVIGPSLSGSDEGLFRRKFVQVVLIAFVLRHLLNRRRCRGISDLGGEVVHEDDCESASDITSP